MKVLLLGTTGLLGHNVLEQLLSHGHEVRALVRTPNKVVIHHDALEVVHGSLDFADLDNSAQGCDAIINCAGVTNMSLLTYDEYVDINSNLPKRLVDVMNNHGINTLVHVSTANTIGYGSKDCMATEECPIELPFKESYYAASKNVGEEFLFQESQLHPEKHIIVVNPGFMIGAYDIKPSSGTLLLTGYRKPLMAAPKGGKSFVSARDAAVAIANALSMGRNGERYLLTGENMSMRDFYRLQAEVMHYRQHLISLPNWLVLAVGRVGDLIRKMSITTQVSTRNVRQLLIMEYYDNSKARRELQMPQTPIAEAIRDFFDWWCNNTQK